MSQKKNITSILALLVALASLAVAAFACYRTWNLQQDYEARLAAMERSLTQLPQESAPVSDAGYECYSNLFVGEWTFENNALCLSTAHAQVLSAPEVTVNTAQTVLYINGEVFLTEDHVMSPGEASDSYTLELENAEYLLPELVEGDMIDLWLEVTLSDGQTLSASGGSWDYQDGCLQLTVG